MSPLDMLYNGNGGPSFGTDGYVKKDDGRLKDIHSYNLFDQVVFGNDGIQADHHQDDVNPVVVVGDNG